MKNSFVARLLALVTLGMFGLALGCSAAGSKKRFGAEADPKAPKVKLAEIMAHPKTYEGKDVVVEGLYAGACGDGDFFFKDGVDIIEADPPQPEVVKLKRGTRISLYGLVKVRGGMEPGESAEKEEHEEKEQMAKAKGKRQEKKEAMPEAQIRIVGKGVEVLQ